MELTLIGMAWVFTFLVLLIGVLVAMRPFALMVAARDLTDEQRAVAAIVAWQRAQDENREAP